MNFDSNSRQHKEQVELLQCLKTGSTACKLKVLENLLGVQVVDTKDNFWRELSDSLRACFVSHSNEIFTRTLKIHHKIIYSPNTAFDGYLNLLRSTSALLNASNSQPSHLEQTLKLALAAQGTIILLLLHNTNFKVTEEIVEEFTLMITLSFDIIEKLDPQANWLKIICYGASIREQFFIQVKTKHEIFLTKSIQSLHLNRSYYNFVCYCLKFNFLHNKEQCLEKIIFGMNADNWQLVSDLITENSNLLTLKTLDSLLDQSDKNLEYVMKIIVNLGQTKHGEILLRKKKPRQLLAKLLDVAVNLMKNELLPPYTLLDCILLIYHNNISIATNVSPTKFVDEITRFYQKKWKNMKINDRIKLLDVFILIYSNLSDNFNNEIVDDIFVFAPRQKWPALINRLGTHKGSLERLKKHTILKAYLEEIWCSDFDFADDLIANFVLFLFIVRLTTKGALALLNNNDDDYTIVDCSHNRILVLGELIEKSLNKNLTDANEEYLGLMTMKVLILNLDVLLYLQANYNLQEKITEEDGVIDAQSNLRHDINLYLKNIGLTIEKQATINEFRDFLLKQPRTNKDTGWLMQARRIFKNSLQDYNPEVVLALIQQLPKTYIYRKTELVWPSQDSVHYQLYAEDLRGISLITSFGEEFGLLQKSEQHCNILEKLIKESRTLLGCQPERFSNFDWFVSITFLLCAGNFNFSKEFLLGIISTPVTSLLWATFGKKFDRDFQDNFYQHLDVVLEENCYCYEALKMLEIPVKYLIESWLNQCFFNFLSFKEICNYITFAALFPPEGTIYYIVAILKHLNKRICTVTHSTTTDNIFEMTKIIDFRLCDHIHFIEQLMKQYRNLHKL